jgi:hypothetical protein
MRARRILTGTEQHARDQCAAGDHQALRPPGCHLQQALAQARALAAIGSHRNEGDLPAGSQA